MKRLARWLLLILLLAIGSIRVFAADTTVTSMDVDCIVDRYGNCAMTVTVTLDGSSGEIWLPIGSDVKSVSVSGYRVSKKTVDGNVWAVVKNDGGAAGTRTFVITYKKLHNVTPNSDKTQTLDVELVNPLWTWNVESMSFSVTMPKEFQAAPDYRSGYFADAVVVEDELDGQTIRGSVPSGLLDQESIDLLMTLPRGYFRLRNLRGGTAAVDLVLVGVLAVLCLVYWYGALRNPLPRRQSRTLSPDGILAWEFPYVDSCGSPDPALLITEWAGLGYLTIAVSTGGRVSLRARIPMSNERKTYECRAFRALFRRGPECAGDTPRCRKIGAQAARSCRAFWNRRLFSRSSGNPFLLQCGAALCFGLLWFRAMDLLLPSWTLRVLLMILALILGFLAGQVLLQAMQDAVRRTPGRHLLLPLLALAVTALLSHFGGGWLFSLLGLLILALAAAGTYHGGKRTAGGMERIAQIRAFRRYLKTASTHHLQLMLNQDGQYFYDLLPYAEALGLGKHLSKRFANIPLEPCVWLEDSSYHGSTALEFYRHYRKILNKMRGISNRTL